MDAVLADPQAAPISAKEKTLLAFVARANGAAHELQAADVEALRATGWSDEAIYDAVTVCALFNFFNVWCDATGVHGMSAADHAASGRRLAQFGYA